MPSRAACHDVRAPDSLSRERSPQVVKRLFDIGAGAIGLVLLSPALCAIALLVKLDSLGPVFFWQSRVGRNGQVFRIYEFRTRRIWEGC
jgi:lipopolysaccharide/colanic/teichoic acid biosynthesis glycosyltransferase